MRLQKSIPRDIPAGAGESIFTRPDHAALSAILERMTRDKSTAAIDKPKPIDRAEIRNQWDGAAPGWAKWEDTFGRWMDSATEVMFEMAEIEEGSRVLDLACGAGDQSLRAARRVGPSGEVIASDISATMLAHVRNAADAAGLQNLSTVRGAAEDLELPAASFDAAICRQGLMLFVDPARALSAVRRLLKPGGKLSAMVFTTPATNAFMAKPMQILLRHAGKEPPPPGRPGIFALGGVHVLRDLFVNCGFGRVDERKMALPLRMPGASDALQMIQEGFGAYRAVLRECSDAVRADAWAEVMETLREFESPKGFEAPSEVLVAAGSKPYAAA